MMQVLRDNTKLIIWILVVAFVGTIIFAWGMDITGSRGGGGKAQQNIVGSVDGKNIPITNFSMMVDQIIDNERQKDPNKEITDSDYKEARRTAWNEYVVGLIQSKEIDARKITLTDPELVDFIRRYPPQQVQTVKDFQTDGRFDYQKYLSAMTNPQYSQLWVQVEQIMRSQLANFKLQEYIGSMVRVSDLDVQNQYVRDNDRIKVEYALVPLSSFDMNSITISDQQISDYYNSHQEEFTAPELAYYTEVKAVKQPSADDSAKAKVDVQELKKQLDAGGDFTTIADAQTMDASGKGKGGDLGWFGHGQMVAAFDSAVFAMKDSTISEPVKTQFGYHIIYRKGSRKTDGKEEVNAAHILIKPTASSETVEKLSQNIAKFKAEANPSNFTSLMTQYGLTTDYQHKLIRKGTIAGIGTDPELEKFLFTAAPNTLSDVLDRADAFYLIRADKVVPAGISPLEEVKALIDRNLKQTEQKKMAYERANGIYSGISSGKPLADAAKAVGATTTETGFFSRAGRLPVVGTDPDFIGTAFSLSDANRYSKPVITQAGAVVIEFKEKIAASLDGFAAQKDTLKNQATMSLQNSYWDRWFTSVRDKVKIEDYRKDVFGEGI